MRRFALCTVSLLFVCALVAIPAPASAAEPGDNVTIYHTNESGFDSAVAVESGIDSGSIHRGENMLVNETLILAIESERLASDLDERDGTPTERFFAALDGEATLGALEGQYTPETKVYDLSITPRNTSVYRAEETTYVLVDTDTIRAYDDDGESWKISGHALLNFAFGYNLDDDDPYKWPSVTAYEVPAHFYGEHDRLAASTVRPDLDVQVAPERSAEARLHLGDDETRTADVADGRDPTFDLPDVEPGTPYRLELVHDGEIVETQTGQVAELNASIEALRVDDGGDDPVLKATVDLSHGGTVYARDEGGEYLSGADVAPNESTDVSLRLDDVNDWNDTITVHVERGDRFEAHYPDHDPVATFSIDDGTATRVPTVNETSNGAAVENVRVAEADGGVTVNATASFPSGGTVYVLDREGDLFGEVSVPAGDEADVSVPLDGLDDWDGYVSVHATDGDRDRHPDDDPVAAIQLSEDEVAALTTAESPENGSNGSDDGDEGSPSDGDSIPGFGAVPALFAFVAAALVACRRR